MFDLPSALRFKGPPLPLAPAPSSESACLLNDAAEQAFTIFAF